MPVQLDRPDFLRLLTVVQAHRSFANVRDRRRLLEAAFEGEPRGVTVLANIDLDGNPRDVATEVVTALMRFGQVAYAREALGVFVNELLNRTGDTEDERFLRALFAKYPLDKPVVAALPITEWRGTQSAAEVEEKIISDNTMRDIRYLEQAIQAARAVVRIAVGSGAGSGFMIAPDLVMTNHHVIHSQAEAGTAEIMFDFQLGLDGATLPTHVARTRHGGMFYTQPDLDFTVVQVDDAPDFGAPLRLRGREIQIDDYVAIIQHPGGNLKKIAMQNNFVAYADPRVVQYYTCTDEGSSGSPVFNDSLEVVAIHHAGGLLEQPGTGRRYLRNQGVNMRSVLDDLRRNAADIFAKLLP